MKKCPKCKEEIADDAKKCKHCGADLRNWFVQHKIWTGVLVLIVLAIIGGVLGGSKGTTNKTPAPDTSTKTTEVQKFNIDDIYAKIQTGMTEAQVKSIVTDPLNCTESETGLGTSKLCTYGNVFTDSGSIMVTYMDGKVSSKTKSQY